MRRKIYGSLALVLLLGTGLVRARGDEAHSVGSVARKVDQYYNHLRAFQAHFTETYEGAGISKSEEGTVLLSKPSEMRWDYQAPHPKLFLVDGKFAYFYVPGDSTAQKMDARKLDDLRSPLRFLLGRTKLESELDNLRLADSSGSEFSLEGVPKGMETRISKVRVEANATGQITALRIEERDGSATTFKFSDFNTNPEIHQDTFHFEPPAGVTTVRKNGP